MTKQAPFGPEPRPPGVADLEKGEVFAFQQGWASVPKGNPGDRTRAGIANLKQFQAEQAVLDAHLIQSERHAYVAGLAWGMAIKHSIDLMPVVDDAGNYTAEAVLDLSEVRPGLKVRLIVLPPEPSDG